MRHLWLSVLSVLTVAHFAGLATPLTSHWGDMNVKHAWKATPPNWESLGSPSPSTTIDLQLALKPANESVLIDTLYEVSTPGNSKYGAYLSREEAAELVAPHQDTLQLVQSWLAHHGIPSSSILRTHGGGWLTVSDVPVSKANEIFGASYQLYRYVGTNDTAILRTVSYSLPEVLHAHVQTVVPTTFFASESTLGLKKTQRHPLAKAAPRQARPREVDPSFLRSLYKSAAYVPSATAMNTLGIVGVSDEFPSPRDLQFFMAVLREDAIDATYTVEQVNGGLYNPNDPGNEANLDMQYAQAMAYPTPIVYYSVGGNMAWSTTSGKPAKTDTFSVLLNYLLKKKKIPPTIVGSFGAPERDLPGDYASAVCFLLAQLSLRGVSILFATGDDGVGPGDCKHPGGTVEFMPNFPTSCPFVTGVGGTTGSEPEIGAELSAGGFSNYFPFPPYQKDYVPPFIKSIGKLYDGLYTPAGRGIPDISAQAVNYVIATNGAPRPTDGTSAAAPVVAGIIALLNDFLMTEGKQPLGFLNPWLYAEGRFGFTDITSGNNPGCDTPGFTAVPGWDPVTGLGTPNFVELMEILFATRVMGPVWKHKKRAFSEFLNISDTAVPTAMEMKERFLAKFSALGTPAHKEN